MWAILLSLALLQEPKVVNNLLPHGPVRDTTKNYVVLHYDSAVATSTTVRWLKKKHNSYHYLIDRKGVIHKLMDPKYKANHAGISFYDGIFGMNNHSVGICLQNDGKSPFTDSQYDSLNWLLGVIVKRFPDIKEGRVLGHSDVAIPRGRKKDPGLHFDWGRVIYGYDY